MSICVVSLGKRLKDPVSPRFGRAPYFLILDDKGEIKEVMGNKGVGAMRGAGVAAAQQISSKASVLITGNVGPNAFNALIALGIKVFLSQPGLSVEESFLMWKKGNLKPADFPAVANRFKGGFARHRYRRRGR